MYDSGNHTVEQIAETFRVFRPTMYRHLSAHHNGRDCALIVYRNNRPKTDTNNRRLGETGQSEAVQLDTGTVTRGLVDARICEPVAWLLQ
jgi:hypothetical protein